MDFSPKVNCLIGNNGMGKTNILDAIYYLSFCKSFVNHNETLAVIRYDEPFMMLQGHYLRRGLSEDISIALQHGKRKVVRRGGKEYERLSQHIGLLPLVVISPLDADLIKGASEERRRFVDQMISQSDPEYLASLIRYNQALRQRNIMIRREVRDPLLYGSLEHILDAAARHIHEVRAHWVEAFTPIFMDYYRTIAGVDEAASFTYKSHLNTTPMLELLEKNRERDFYLGYTSTGIHRDDIDLLLAGHPMRKAASQGQSKTYTIALRMAQFNFLKAYTGITPILLLDDIFDRLDAERVERIVALVSQEQFGQIFITDTNRTHLDSIIASLGGDNTMMEVEDGNCTVIHTTGGAAL